MSKIVDVSTHECPHFKKHCCICGTQLYNQDIGKKIDEHRRRVYEVTHGQKNLARAFKTLERGSWRFKLGAEEIGTERFILNCLKNNPDTRDLLSYMLNWFTFTEKTIKIISKTSEPVARAVENNIHSNNHYY